LTAVWGAESREEVEYLRTFVRQLRKKIEDDPSKPLYLLTDVYVGYRFADAQMFLEGSYPEGSNLEGSAEAEEMPDGESIPEDEDVPEDEHEPPKVID
jgi:DNA-binding winged helix-turn-helix (wHTH) protein